MRVRLSDAEIEQARERGQRLKEVNAKTKDTPAYSDQTKKVYKDEGEAGFVMSIAECAVAKATDREWHAKVWPAAEHHLHKDEPDVGRNIEVRHVTQPGAGLVVRKKDLGKGKVLFLAYPDPETDYTEVEVIGWLSAEEAWERGREVDDYRRVPQSQLKVLR